MMFCFPGDSVPAPTQKSQVLVKILRIIFFFELIICIPKVWFSIWCFLMELIGCIYLYYAYNQLNYCNCVIYIFFCLMNIVNILDVLGNLIQQNVNLLTFDTTNLVILIDSFLSFIIYVVSIYYAFQAYKEFKGIALDVIKASSSDYGFSMTHHTDINMQNNVIEMKTPNKNDRDFI